MKVKLGFLTFAVGSLISMTIMAQDTQTDNHVITINVPNVALLDLETSIEGGKNFEANFIQGTPLEAGEKITDPEDNSDTWLNYSSILPSGTESRRVDVKASVLVPGVDIKVTAGKSATGKGTLGTPAGEVTLKTDGQEIVSKIGSAYTTSGPSNGHKLTYVFEANDDEYGKLVEQKTAVTVTYTLADN